MPPIMEKGCDTFAGDEVNGPPYVVSGSERRCFLDIDNEAWITAIPLCKVPRRMAQASVGV